MRELVVASNNKHKIEEMNSLLGSSFLLKGLSEIGCYEELAETQDTLEGNALQKAAYVFNNYHLPCFADDTGLEVDALNGEPGVYSAHYAGPHRNSDDNIELLFQKLGSLKNRQAQFRTIITLVESSGVKFFEGILTGEIIHEKRGNQGFGYDPVFQPLGFDKTLAEMSMNEKNRISHRALAINKLIDYLTKH